MGKMQLPLQDVVDSVYWRFEMSGAFIVKSCYYALLERATVSNLPSNYIDQCLNQIWNLKVRPKICRYRVDFPSM